MGTIEPIATPGSVAAFGFRHERWYSSFCNLSELTDTFLYTASLLAAGAALGFTRLFVASETELQQSAVRDGKIIQHSHFMYTAATQRAVARILGPYGIQFGAIAGFGTNHHLRQSTG